MKVVFGHGFDDFKTISPQGDGNTARLADCGENLIISKPYPRKGTETILYPILFIPMTIFQNHIPARGRKHVVHRVESVVHVIISKPYPRKGTETIGRLITTIPNIISKPYPRKGTETCENVRSSDVGLSNFKTISPQGDGNDMFFAPFNETKLQFQNHIPARGRGVPPASPARAGEGDRVSGGGGAMDASRKPS